MRRNDATTSEFVKSLNLSSIVDEVFESQADKLRSLEAEFETSDFVENLTNAIVAEELRAVAEIETRVGALVDKAVAEQTTLAAAYANATDAQEAAQAFEGEVKLYTVVALMGCTAAALVLTNIAHQLQLPFF